MKKLLAFLFTLVTILCTLVPVCACCDPTPALVEYDVQPKKNGTAYYTPEWDEVGEETIMKKVGTLNKNDTVHILYESDFGGKMFGGFEVKKGDDYEYYYISLDSINITPNKRYSSKKGFTTEEETYLVVAPKGVRMRKGPGFGYEVVRTIPKGAKLRTHIVENNPDCDNAFDALSGWFYTSYWGFSGWVNNEMYNYDDYDYDTENEPLRLMKVLPDGQHGSFVVLDNKAKGYDANGHEICTLPKSQVFEYSAYYTDYGYNTSSVMIRYNNRDVFVSVIDSYTKCHVGFDCLMDNRDILQVWKDVDIPLSTTPGENKSSGTVHYKAWDTISWKYRYFLTEDDNYYNYYYVEKDGKKGWLRDDINELTDIYTQSSTPDTWYGDSVSTVSRSVSMYTEPSFESETCGTLTPWSDFKIKAEKGLVKDDNYSTWYYVTCGNAQGWINSNDCLWIHNADDYNTTLSGKRTMYEKPDRTSQKLDTTIPDGTALHILQYTTYFWKVTYNGVTGWIENDYSLYTEEDDEEYDEYEDDDDYTEYEETDEYDYTEEPEFEEMSFELAEPAHSLALWQIILCAVSGAAVLVAAVVIGVKVAKSKKKK